MRSWIFKFGICKYKVNLAKSIFNCPHTFPYVLNSQSHTAYTKQKLYKYVLMLTIITFEISIAELF